MAEWVEHVRQVGQLHEFFRPHRLRKTRPPVNRSPGAGSKWAVSEDSDSTVYENVDDLSPP